MKPRNSTDPESADPAPQDAPDTIDLVAASKVIAAAIVVLIVFLVVMLVIT
jgi:hypothetical protein